MASLVKAKDSLLLPLISLTLSAWAGRPSLEGAHIDTWCAGCTFDGLILLVLFCMPRDLHYVVLT
jgi:hypothetical protein